METCNYSFNLQVQVSLRFEIDLGPGPELDNNRMLLIKYIYLSREEYTLIFLWPKYNTVSACMQYSNKLTILVLKVLF